MLFEDFRRKRTAKKLNKYVEETNDFRTQQVLAQCQTMLSKRYFKFAHKEIQEVMSAYNRLKKLNTYHLAIINKAREKARNYG